MDVQTAMSNFGRNANNLLVTDTTLVCTKLPAAFTVFLLYLATAGETRSQLGKIFKFDPQTDDKSLIEALEKYSKSSLPTDPSSSFNLISKIYVNQKFSLKPDFLQTVNNKFFNSSIESVPDFSPATRKGINEWVASATNNRITNLVPQAVSSSDQTSMLMLTAMYLKLAWEIPFAISKTAKAEFTNGNGKIVHVPFLINDSPLRGKYLETPLMQYFEMRFKDKKWVANFLLPWPNTTVDEVWRTHKLANKIKWAQEAEFTPVKVQIPRFQFTYSDSLVGYLKQLNVTSLFTPQADFSKLTSTPGLFLSEADTKSFLAVNEEGVESAAIAAAKGENLPVAKGSKHRGMHVTFTANRPFILVIQNNAESPDWAFGPLTLARVDNLKEE